MFISVSLHPLRLKAPLRVSASLPLRLVNDKGEIESQNDSHHKHTRTPI